MNKGRILREFPDGIWTTDELAKEGWKLVEFCQGRNALGINAILARGIARAGIVRHGNGYALVEVIL